MPENSGVKFSPAEAGEEIWAAYTQVRARYRTGGMSASLFMLHVVHSAEALMEWGCQETALRLLGDVGTPLLRRELPDLAAESISSVHVIFSLAHKLVDAGLGGIEELTIAISPGGRPS